MSDRAIIRAFMQGLVEKVGGVEPAAAIISARLGSDASKGTISKRLSGHLDWPLVEIMALEDAALDPCVRRWLAQSLPELAQERNLLLGIAEAAREHGEAMGAAMDFASGRGTRAVAIKEVQDTIVAGTKLVALINEVGGDHGD